MKRRSTQLLFLVSLLICSSIVLADHHEGHDDAHGSTVNPTGYSTEDLESMRTKAEHHTFQAEVSQLLDILVNSLYSNKDVFLRELISNSADALSKIRFLSLTDTSILGSTPDLAIYIKADVPNRILHIIDSGIGMTHNDMVENLGRIAKSGTKEFLNALSQSGGDTSNLIGKFGVGFYSAFLVADVVRVTSKHNDDDQWVWESTADGSFTVTKDPHGNTLGRGTQVSLLLKDGLDDYLDEDNIEKLIHKYSEFVNYPIYLWTSHEVEVPAEKEEHAEAPADETDSVVDLEEEEEEDEDEEPAKPATETIEVWEWERVNARQPLWTLDPADISQEQYESFYKSLSNDNTAPLTHSHFSAEGDINFRSILFVPSVAPENLFGSSNRRPLKLFVKRVFITDDFDDIMPKYLNFIHGIVDSDDLDLNVSREVLQQSKTLSTIQKKLVRKAISMFQEMAADEPEKYNKFFEIFGTNIKWGYLEDKHNKARLEKLLRFHSSKADGLTGFDDYIERMQEGQEQIFYIAGDNKESLAASPLLEKLTKRGYEVLFLTEPIDEYVTQTLTRYGDHSLTNLAKEGFKLDGEEEEDQEVLNEKYSALVAFLKKALGHSKVANVVLSHRLESVPAALVSGQWGWTANMERIAKAQALSDKSSHSTLYKARRVLEINPTHPIIVALRERFDAEGESDTVSNNVAQLVYHTALLTSGFELEDPAELSQQLQRVMSESLSIEEEKPADEVESEDII